MAALDSQPSGLHPSAARQLRHLTLALIPGLTFMFAFVVRSALHQGSLRFTLFDDALISFAYGRTLAQTGEWVWFPGADRVQGITNPLWSAIMALPHVLQQSANASIALFTVLNMAIMIGIAIVTYATLAVAGPTHKTALVAAGAVPFLYPLTFWTLRGMEVGLLAFLLLFMVLAALKSTRASSQRSGLGWIALAGVAGALMVATRMDALLGAGVVAGLAVIFTSGRHRRAWLIVVAGLAASLLAVLVFQDFYWGDLLPNTYRLKVEGVTLADRLIRGSFATSRALPLAILLALALARVKSSSLNQASRQLIFYGVGVTAVTLAYSVWTGGDAWEWSLILNRSMSAVLPLAIAAWIVACVEDERIRLPWLVALAMSGVSLGITVNPLGFDSRIGFIGLGLTLVGGVLVLLATRFRPMEVWRPVLAALGFLVVTSSAGAILWITQGGLNVADDQRFAARSDDLAQVTTPSARIAVMWAGAPGYFSERSVIDMFGKSDRIVAEGPPNVDPSTGKPYAFIPGHNKWNYEYSIGELKPDVVFQLGDDRDTAEQQVLDWGYQRGCLSDGWVSYFYSESPYVKWDQISPC